MKVEDEKYKVKKKGWKLEMEIGDVREGGAASNKFVLLRPL